MGLLDRFYKNVGIDLGTANSLVYLPGKGIVVNEPTLVAVNVRTNQILAIGHDAKKMLDRTPSHISLIKPLMAGVISDFETTEEILKYFLNKASEGSLISRYRLAAISVPTNLTEVERKSVEDAVISAGVSKVLLVEEPIAAALGAGLPIGEIKGSMVVDIGGGTTEVAVMSMTGVVASRSLRVAGDEMDEDIVQYLRNKYNLLIGQGVAEQVKWSIGSAFPLPSEKTMEVRGRNLVTGLPETIEVSSVEIREALSGSVQVIVDTIRDALDEIPPEIVADLMDLGICLAGGGALLQ